ncbi:hypothetical protein I2494_01665 [Budviciaceae bacterium BWR-B9]|uniref:Uncharacterized protein n=1 Tax=Limnobaculum allomyrinae TaxID=2791986 RepID=A0ABS1IL60_9GAMM|nr:MULTISPECIES: hypothetical protein [Limnobaculum]MBK5142442.1 hypothetical protein [Limnobaculum allomyrinae]MBV7690673.1 hypothetical protein [Limnobaculum sp. M2-1]
MEQHRSGVPKTPKGVLDMAKQTGNRMAFKDFEEQANDFISLTFDYCEEELRRIPSHDSLPKNLKRQALAFATISVQQSIEAFLAISQIADNK